MNQPSVEELQQELQKAQLKIRALLEDITETREKNAEYRVDITMLSQMVQDAQQSQAAQGVEESEGPSDVVEPTAVYNPE